MNIACVRTQAPFTTSGRCQAKVAGAEGAVDGGGKYHTYKLCTDIFFTLCLPKT